MKNLLRFVAAALLVVGMMPPVAQAGAVETIFVRAKAGAIFYSNVDPVSSAFGAGLDLGFRCDGGFGLTGMGRLGFAGNGSDISNPSIAVNSDVKSFFLGIAPSYSVKKGIATLSFGMGVGVLSTTTRIDTFSSTLLSNVLGPDVSRSRFALVPAFEADFDIVSGLFANVGIQYIATIGNTPHPSAISPMGGVGYRF